jgi:hypothetical protein
MVAEQQQGSGKQLDLFDEALKATPRHDVSGKGGTGAGTNEERPAPTAWGRDPRLDVLLDGSRGQFGQSDPSLQAGESV